MFRWASSSSRSWLPSEPLVLFFPVCLLLGGVVTGSPGLWSIGAGGVGALIGVLVVKHRWMWRALSYVLPAGHGAADAHGSASGWSGPMERIDVVESRMASPRTIGRLSGVQCGRSGGGRGSAAGGSREVRAQLPAAAAPVVALQRSTRRSEGPICWPDSGLVVLRGCGRVTCVAGETWQNRLWTGSRRLVAQDAALSRR